MSYFLYSVQKPVYYMSQNLLRSWSKHQRQRWAELFLMATETPPKEKCCLECTDADAVYTCDDCTGPLRQYSQPCLVKAHLTNPLHCISVCALSYHVLACLDFLQIWAEN
jgi:hypothetical protein